MSYGEFRSQLALNTAEGFKNAFVIANALDHPDEKEVAIKHWWRVVDPDLIIGELQWMNKNAHTHESLYFIDEDHWKLNLGDALIASNKTLDLQPIQKKWAVIPAKDVLHIWEDWAKDRLSRYVDVPRKCIEMLERGYINPELVVRCKQALDTAIAMSQYDVNNAAYAADAIYATYTIDHERNTARHAAIRAAAAFPVDSSVKSPSWTHRYDYWCVKFTAHVFSILKEQNAK